MLNILVIVVLGAIGAYILCLVLVPMIVVGGKQIAILERRYFGKTMSDGHVIAIGNEIGIQARILGPGLYFLNPITYAVRKSTFTVIAEDEIGMIEAIDGRAIPQGHIFATVADKHNTFQDGEAFLLNGGEKGPQVEIIPPGTYRINPSLFKLTVAKAIEIPPGKIGIITAMDGASMTPGRLLAKHVKNHNNFENGQAFLSNGGQRGPQIDVLMPGAYRINTALFKIELRPATIIPTANIGLVTALDGAPLPDNEFVAKKVDNHMDYQNASLFLDAGGQRGPQLEVLKPGTYYINPSMFQIALEQITEVQRGQVAVIISNIGAEAPMDIISMAATELVSGQERYVVAAGYRGIQQNVLGPGRYYLNVCAEITYIIDTTNIIIDWATEDKHPLFKPLLVISKDGFAIEISMKVIIRVRPDQAPYMVAKIGSIDNLVQHVIQPTVASSLRNQASETSAMSFMLDRQVEQKKVEERARLELEKYHVECVSVLICQINLPQELMDTQTQRIIAREQMEMYKAEGYAEEQRATMEKKRAQADMQPKLVDAEIGVQIATQAKLKTVISAEAEGESKRLIAEGEAAGIRVQGDAEAARILAIGKSTAESYDLQNKAIGGNGVTAIEIAKQIAAGNVKITPDFLVQAGDSSGGLMSAYLATLIGHSTQKSDLL
jgi:regulator of protease activity HflC (stomatin/prohibitin superfamily)